MGEYADLVLEGAQCSTCGQWMQDVIDGFDPPGHPRWCVSCSKPTVKQRQRNGKARHSGAASPTTIMNAYMPKSVLKARKKDWGKVYTILGEYELKTYSNNGADHLKYYGRFNYWPSKEKWWDSVTNIKGQGANEFLSYVQEKITELKLNQG